MMNSVVDQFSSNVAQVQLRPPTIPFVSCVSGTWISEHEATDPAYWARHLRAPVQFSRGMQELLSGSPAVLLEVGPGNVLSTIVKQQISMQNGRSTDIQKTTRVVSSFGDASSGDSSFLDLLSAAGSLWSAGLQLKWEALHSGERRQRIPLPTYPFERKRFWLELSAAPTQAPTQIRHTPPTETEFSDTSLEETHNVTQHQQGPTLEEQPVVSRAALISSMVSDIFADLSGVQMQPSDVSSTFLEMGFDSLFLTQIAQALHGKFGLKVTFRQLLGDQSSLKSLTEFIDSQLSAEALTALDTPAHREKIKGEPDTSSPTAKSVAQPQPPSNYESSASETAVERLMREQMQVMSQLFANQLEALRGISAEQSGAKTQNELPHPAAALAKSADSSSSPARPSSPSNSLAVAAKESTEFKPFGPYKPPQTPKGTSSQLTEAQQKHIQALIERCTERTAKSKSMTQQYRSKLADPRVVSGFRTQWKEMVYPIFTVRSKGSRLWDVDGNEYIDILNGFGPIMLGHRPDFVERAMEQQLHEGFEIGPQTPLAGEVAEMFCDMTGNERMAFCNTGSEAVLAALRVSRTVTGRNKVVMFAGDYHGMFDEVLVKGFKNKAGEPQSAPIAPGIPRQSVSNMIVLDYGTEESLEWIRQNARDLAAVLVEPVQSRHPDTRPVEFLREVRRITEASETALIFDEVVTGFRV